MKKTGIQPVQASRAKLGEVVSNLEGLARRLGPEGKFPTVRQLSRDLGVALGTLDQGLTRLEQRGLISRQGRRGIFVSPQVSQRRIGIVFGGDIFLDPADYFFRALLRNCIAKLQSRGHACSIFLDIPNTETSQNSSVFAHEDLMFAINAGRLDGIMYTYGDGQEIVNGLTSLKVPFVSLSNGNAPHQVNVDHRGAMTGAVDAIQRLGCQSVGFLHRHAGSFLPLFEEAIADSSLTVTQNWCQLGTGSARYEEEGRTLTRSLLSRHRDNLPDALVVPHDQVARGVCLAMEEAGVIPGRDIMIAAFDNLDSPSLQPWAGTIIRCETNLEELADALVTRLESEWNDSKGDTTGSLVPIHLKIPGHQAQSIPQPTGL